VAAFRTLGSLDRFLSGDSCISTCAAPSQRTGPIFLSIRFELMQSWSPQTEVGFGRFDFGTSVAREIYATRKLKK
jgi:hypothetical protein